MIAEWAGWKKEHRGWRSPEGVFYFDEPSFESLALIPQYPDYCCSNAAMDLLRVLVERGYKVDVQSDGPQWSMVLQHPGMKRAICSLQSTIPAAICHAILELIEREWR